MEEVPFDEYPRPQLRRRAWLNLNGRWHLRIERGGASCYDGEILVPFSPEAPLSGTGLTEVVQPQDTLVYCRTFRADALPEGARTLLHFGAVDSRCRVFVNGKECGGHIGGYTPFSVEIGAALRRGDNELRVEVRDGTETSGDPRGKQRRDHGGIWYRPQSGIWQTVWAESLNPHAVEELRIEPDIDRSCVELRWKTQAPETEIELYFQGKLLEKRKTSRQNLRIDIKNPRLWTPEDPALYDLVLRTDDDEAESYFGMRKFSVGSAGGKQRLLLNNKPYFQNGLLDQGYWQDGLLTPPSDDAMAEELRAVKRMGFNMLRKHIKLEPLRWYYYCDKLGLLVWQDLVNGGGKYRMSVVAVLPFLGIRLDDGNYRLFGTQDAQARQVWRDTAEETVAALRNCVSLAMWVPFNEGWGQFDSLEAAARIKELDGTRPVDAASGWHDMGGDFVSMHTYFVPLRMPRRRGRPVLLSEFGGYSLPVEGHCPAKRFGYRKFRTREKWQVAYEKLYLKKLTPLIERGLSACVYTQLSDVEEEINGLFTYDRAALKADEAFFRRINDAVAAVARASEKDSQ